MKISEKNAKKLFLEFYPDGIGFDYAGRKMILDNYGKDNLDTGWNIDHVIPLSKGGTNQKENLQCTNCKTNRIKGNQIEWKDENMNFKLTKLKNKNTVVKVNEINEKKDYNLNEDELAIKIFKKKYPLGVGYDIMNRKVVLEDYLNKNKYTGWGLVKLNPRNTKIFDERNYDVFNIASMIMKNNKTSWEDNDHFFQVEKENGSFKTVEVIHNEGVTRRKEVCSNGIN